MIVCLRTVGVPTPEHRRYLDWITEGRVLRQDHGILAELVLEPTSGDGETVVVTIWPSHDVFDAWIATPDRDRLTASDVHAAVDYRPITRYDVVGGYLNSIDCRCQTRSAVAARKLGVITAEHAVALSLSVTHKAVGFDRRFPEIDFDSLDLPSTGTLPMGVEGPGRYDGARNPQQPRRPFERPGSPRSE